MPLRAADVARHLNADHSLVARWVRRGMPLTCLDDALAWHAASIRTRNRPASRAADPPPAPAADAPVSSTAAMTRDLLAARLLREQSDARTAQLRLAEVEGRLIDRDAVGRALAGHITGARDALLNLGARLAPVLATETDPAVVLRLLRAEHHRALEMLAAGAAALDAPEAASC